jgi:hypothetical protein
VEGKVRSRATTWTLLGWLDGERLADLRVGRPMFLILNPPLLPQEKWERILKVSHGNQAMKQATNRNQLG